MKYDTTKKATIGAKRTFTVIYSALIKLLEKKDFDTLQVQEICEESMIPRATFYNYFDDKYDLLYWCFSCLEKSIYSKIDIVMDHSLDIDEIITNILDLADEYHLTLDRILKTNPKDGGLYKEFSSYFINASMRLMKSCTLTPELKVPAEMIAKMHAYAFLTVFEWAYIDKHDVPKSELFRYIHTLIHSDGLK
jgi:AcrR family transcriptional regulator